MDRQRELIPRPGCNRRRDLSRGVPKLPHNQLLSGPQALHCDATVDQDKIQAMIGDLQFMHNGVMPPFAGTTRNGLRWLPSSAPFSRSLLTAPQVTDGKIVFQQNCGMCHEGVTRDVLINGLPKDPNAEREA